MLCNHCGKNEATIHSVQYINGHKSEVHLCQECAQNSPELKSLGGLSATDLFKKLFNMNMSPGIMLENSIVCDSCGETLHDFQKTGLLGCPDCYETYKDQIVPVLQRAHGNVQHVGEAPELSAEQKKAKQKELTLKQKLQQAIATEDFEQAAKLRDEINALNDTEE